MMVAVVEAGLGAPGVGISIPEWEQVKTRVLMLQVDVRDIPRTWTPDDINGVAAALIAGGVTTPYWLEMVGKQVECYPYVRSETDVLDNPTP